MIKIIQFSAINKSDLRDSLQILNENIWMLNIQNAMNHETKHLSEAITSEIRKHCWNGSINYKMIMWGFE